ncbi:exonuclease SbcCD subunit D [Chloroflexota bacterium]
MSFRFIHAADIHLDSPLRGLFDSEGHAAERIRTATREAFDNLISLAIDEQVDFLIIAGDLYDGDWKDYNTGLFFVRHMGRLNEAGILVFIVYGNHDAESQITRRLILPENVRPFSSRKPETLLLESIGVALHGQSYKERNIVDNLVTAYPARSSGMFNIGVLHTGIGGMGGHENYAPCTIEELVNKGYDYWALGHVHQSRILHKQPYIVFPGNLQGRHIRETGQKGAYLITVDEKDITDIEPLYTDTVRWIQVSIDASNYQHMPQILSDISSTLEKAIAHHAEGRLLACRIEINGQSQLHSELTASRDSLLAQARALAMGLGEDAIWIEKVIITTNPIVDLGTLQSREDALGALLQILDDASADSELLRQLESDVDILVRKLPYEIRVNSEDSILKTAIEGNYANLISQVSDYLIARIVGEGE